MRPSLTCGGFVDETAVAMLLIVVVCPQTSGERGGRAFRLTPPRSGGGFLSAVAALTTAVSASGAGLADAADAAEVFQQALAGARADAGDGVEFGVAVAHLAALAVIGDGEAVGLVADLLDQVQHRRAAVEHDRVGLLAVDVDDLFASWRSTRARAGPAFRLDADLGQRFGGGVQLAKAAVDEDERGNCVFSLSCPSRRL